MARQRKNAVWQTRDGRELKIRDMSTDHIQHVIYMLMRGTAATLIKRAADLMNTPIPSFQGEMAQYYSAQAWEDEHQVGVSMQMYARDPVHCFNCVTNPALRSLLDELEHRGVQFDNTVWRLPEHKQTPKKSLRLGNYVVTFERVR